MPSEKLYRLGRLAVAQAVEAQLASLDSEPAAGGTGGGGKIGGGGDGYLLRQNGSQDTSFAMYDDAV